MAKYLVQRRMQEDKTYLPGEILDNPDHLLVDRLVQRGYLVVVPDNYEGSPATSAPSEPEAPEGDEPGTSSSDAAGGGTTSESSESEGGGTGAATEEPSDSAGPPNEANEPPDGTEPTDDVGGASSVNPDEGLPKTIDLSEVPAEEATPDGEDQEDKEAK